MGLDIHFVAPGDEGSLFYLRNHDDFFDLLCNPEPEPYRPEYSDFLVTHDVLDRMDASMSADLEAEGLSWNSVPEQLPHDFAHWDAREMPWAELVPGYLRLIEELRACVDEHEYIICSWSA